MVLSLLLHGVLFLSGSPWLVRPAQYGVEAGFGGIEISLVAAPRQEEGQAEPPHPTESPAPAGEISEAVAGPPAPKTPSGRLAESRASPGGPAGDGSAPVPGQDPTTLSSSAGAFSRGGSAHGRNPAPPYPWASMVRGEEGVVILTVSVDTMGRPTQVAVARSSGFPLLDESSVTAVRRWTFDPAHRGLRLAQSSLPVPIRFVLKTGAGRSAPRPATPPP